MKDIQQRPSCSVTKELVQEVANSNPEKFKNSRGEVIVERVLFVLGFQIKDKAFNRGIYVNNNVLVRDRTYPDRVYKTTVYNGNLRNKIDRVEDGKIIFGKGYHWLHDIYYNVSVLQPEDLTRHLSEDDFKNILTIGELEHYNKINAG